MEKNVETSCEISQWQILSFRTSSDLAEKCRCTKGKPGKLQLKLAQPLNVAEGKSNIMWPISSFSEADLGKSLVLVLAKLGKQPAFDF